MEKKIKQWSVEETKCLVAVWSTPEFQSKLDSAVRKGKCYQELAEALASAGFTRTIDQIINKLKKLKKDYRDTKKDLNKSGHGRPELDPSYEILDTVLGCRPANQLEGALNSSLAANVTSGTAEEQNSSPGSTSTTSRSENGKL